MATTLDSQIAELANSLNLITPAARDLVESLVLMNNANQASANSTLKNVNVRNIENELLQRREERERALIGLFQNLGGSLTRAISGLGNFSTQLYSTASFFDSARVTFEAVSDILKTLIKISSDTASIFGRLGQNAGAVFSTIANSGVDLAINAMKNRIEQIKIISDTFQMVAKSGATFGGSLDVLMDAAKTSGINLQEFGKFVVGNMQNLTGYGTTISQSSQTMGRLTRQITDLDPALLVMKGSFGALAESAAEYFALQRQIGVNELSDSKESASRVKEYIRLQNELSEITGRSVAEQRRSEEQRRQVASYQLAASKLEGDQRNNLMALMSLFDTMGPDMASSMQEYFANNGKMVNSQNITFATLNKEIFDMGVAMMQTINQPTEQFKKSMADVAAGFAPAIRGAQASLDQSGLLMLAGSRVGGDVVGMLGRTTAAMIPFLNNLENLPKIFDKLASEAAKSTAPPGSTIDKFKQSIELQNNLKIELDGLARENISALIPMINTVSKVATEIVRMEQGVSAVANAILSGQGVLPALRNFTGHLEATFIKLFGSGAAGTVSLPNVPTGGLSNPSVVDNPRLLAFLEQNQRATTQLTDFLTQARTRFEGATPGSPEREQASRQIYNLEIELNLARYQLQRLEEEKRRRNLQEGGIATEPTIVGENNQPEAVIPLARGAIPLNINLDPMIKILEQQREFLEEILSSTKNNSDYLERIYHAG